MELSRAGPGGPIRVGVLLEGSADGVQSRSVRMAGLLGKAEVADGTAGWWPGAPRAAAGETLVRVSFWVSALARVLDAIDGGGRPGGRVAARSRARRRGRAVPAGRRARRGGGGIREGPARRARRDQSGAVAGERGAVVVLAAPAAVREELAARGGMNGTVPGLALMRAVKDQFDPGHRMAPGRFPEGS